MRRPPAPPWVEPELLNGWENVPHFIPVAYSARTDYLCLRGTARGGEGAIFQLPPDLARFFGKEYPPLSRIDDEGLVYVEWIA